MKFTEEVITIPLAPDYEQYLKSKMVKSYSVRDGDGKLVGYSVYVLKSHPHYKNSLWAVQDIIYIDPARRGYGMFLIKWCDEQLKLLGVQVVSHHVKVSNDWSKALIRMGYDFQDKILTKRLDK